MAAMTHEQVARALGLMPPELWRCCAVAENVKRGRGLSDFWDPKVKREVLGRGTGRSTSLMVQALVDVSQGKAVTISAYEPSWEAKMVRQIKAWAEKLGLDAKLVYAARRSAGPNHKGLYVDHYLGPDGWGKWAESEIPREEKQP